MKSKKQCGHCGKMFEVTHHNQKYHRDCAYFLRKTPRGKLLPEQEAVVRKLAGTMLIQDLANKIGTSNSNLDRWARDNNVSINSLKYPDHVVREVCSYYEKHGKVETQKAFPEVKVRSIIERYYTGKPRQTRWTDQQLIDLARIANFASTDNQAKYFNRPRAHGGSITSAWNKKFGMYPGNLHGWNKVRAKQFVTRDCPYIDLPYFVRKGEYSRKLALWVDIHDHLKSDCPDFVKDAISALAKFQTWLYGDDPRLAILNIMEGLK